MKGSSALKGDSTQAQNDVRDPSDPSAHHDKAEAKTNVDDSSAGLDLGKNPDKIDGPGPRPLEEVAREHGGDAGKSASDESLGHKSDDRSSEEDQDHHDAGTGELYVRSSGLKADGGDFDAAAPGAGREADREFLFFSRERVKSADGSMEIRPHGGKGVASQRRR